MNILVTVLTQCLLSAGIVLLACLGEHLGLAAVAVSLLGVSAIAAKLAPQASAWRWWFAAGWVCTLVSPVSACLVWGNQIKFEYGLDKYYAVAAWLVSLGLLPTLSGLHPAGFVTRWKVAVLTWAALGGACWLVVAYIECQAGAFYFGLLVNVALLVVGQLWLRLPLVLAQAMNTLILLLVGLPLADLLTRSDASLRAGSEVRQKHYSYQAAKKDSVAFSHWWNYYLSQWESTERTIYMPDPTGRLPYRLRPNSRSQFFQSQISINSRGFRGREILADKGRAYRIIALGESTTFGITLEAEDRPWPELLEQLIREKLPSSRTVEVVNAGVPGYGLTENVERMVDDILPLQPDLVISYHGINGFPLLYSALPGMVGTPPPLYRLRPLRLLADCEYRLKLLSYRRHYTALKATDLPVLPDPLQTRYGNAYQQLIQLCRTNHIPLVLGNYSMAVNEGSDRDAVLFYQAGYPATAIYVKANAIHSELVKKLTGLNPEVGFADTHPHLDGDQAKFIDLVHFDALGEKQMAQNVFESIRPVLEPALGPETAAPK